MAGMAKTAKKKTGKHGKAARKPFYVRFRRIVWRSVAVVFLAVMALTGLYAVINPPITPYMISEARRIGPLERTWVDMDEIAPVMARSVVAAEDANFCLHWGLDVGAIRAALDDGGARGASTISQQVVKNVYLWHGRSWLRKSLEALWTPLVEAVWSKRRILEVYLNVAEFDEGVFGVQAAARHYYGVDAVDLTARQSARLAVLLPSPKSRNPNDLTFPQSRRANSISDGAATILSDGRADCFGG